MAAETPRCGGGVGLCNQGILICEQEEPPKVGITDWLQDEN